MPPIPEPLRAPMGYVLSPTGVAVLPRHQLLGLLLGAALLDQGYSVEQAGEWVRRANEAVESSEVSHA